MSDELWKRICIEGCEMFNGGYEVVPLLGDLITTIFHKNVDVSPLSSVLLINNNSCRI